MGRNVAQGPIIQSGRVAPQSPWGLAPFRIPKRCCIVIATLTCVSTSPVAAGLEWTLIRGAAVAWANARERTGIDVNPQARDSGGMGYV